MKGRHRQCGRVEGREGRVSKKKITFYKKKEGRDRNKTKRSDLLILSNLYS